MKQSIIHVALVVRDYEEAIAFFCQKLHFELVEDTYQPEQDKRWVVVSPLGSNGTSLLLARAATSEQEAFIGRQSGGRVFLFSAQMTSGVTIMRCFHLVSSLSGNRELNLTER